MTTVVGQRGSSSAMEVRNPILTIRSRGMSASKRSAFDACITLLAQPKISFHTFVSIGEHPFRASAVHTAIFVVCSFHTCNKRLSTVPHHNSWPCKQGTCPVLGVACRNTRSPCRSTFTLGTATMAFNLLYAASKPLWLPLHLFHCCVVSFAPICYPKLPTACQYNG